ncbi:6-phosphogluconate dehydrogenase C-terminal domain-like protein [Annulohypoxylon truncatum]|uniref:6-phosphogluconate dehydrogenase C-terminal domain-like protein n=1 Tax=Annulohypoxylon truncatum TaxID=327061 RepID=UPI00200735A0|nr:6-phosphogluconate dehydrogenase C-terminal domain-like protein [Annulohypoxylon truncatum]KAI1211053.1 6-phosphogluconate dehydrogenase C-terminal domain-like protein [Annulohypoxylon truncatum]
MASPLAKIGIISIGDMGVGIAKLLIANGFSVATNIKGRSNDTLERAKAAQVELLDSDEALTQSCPVILSVVPPRDAVATAQRIVDALTGPLRRDPSSPLYFADLNAVAPSSVKRIAALFSNNAQLGFTVRFVDGSILGGPPHPKPGGSSASPEWYLPSIPTSGPNPIAEIPGYGPKLSATLNMKHISTDVGAASGLKMCFASFSKGFTSLAIQAFTTAHRLGVLPTLKSELAAVLPTHLATAERGVVGMAPKAYRWVGEMEEIARTLSEEGGFDPDSFIGAAKVYRTVADDTVLGEEKIGKRKRGTTVEDVALAMAEGLQTKRKKND